MLPVRECLSVENFWFTGAGAVEYIICHAEVSIAFVEEKKISEVNRVPGMHALTCH